MPVRIQPVLPLVLLGVAGCHSGSSGDPVQVNPNTGLRAEGTRTRGGEGDALAAALLLSADHAVQRTGRARLQMTDRELRDRLVAMSIAQLYANAITAENGPGQAGSAQIRRLAAESSAPSDRNGNGNLDETLEVLYQNIALQAGSSGLPVLRPILFPWEDGTADFAAATDPKAPSQRTRPGRVGVVDTEQVGQALLARVLLASGLLKAQRGDQLGATPTDGTVGLIMLQQAVAMEETLFASLFMNGPVLGSLRFPTDYDPAQELRWVPRKFTVGVDAAGNAATYAIADRSSSLAGLAALMRAAAELYFLGTAGNPSDLSRDAFQGLQIGRLPSPDEPGGGGGGSIVTWEDGVDKLLAFWCAGCHNSQFKPEPGLFAADSYENVHRGGRNSRPGSSTPIIVRGNAEASVLYNILLANPPRPFLRMPDGGPYFAGKDLQLIKDWIDDGARSAPPRPPRIGLDLALIMFKNLVAMHVGPNGELYERHDGQAPLPFTNPAATGAALQALAALAPLEYQLVDYRKTLTAVAGFAAANLVTANGDVVGSFDITAGKASGVADLFGQARLTAGLLAASRTLSSATLRTRAETAARRLLDGFFVASDALFRNQGARPGSRYTPRSLAAVVDALREMADHGVAGAVATHEAFLRRILPVLAFSELDGAGEVLGDDIPDTDGNGLKEPTLAGGPFGRAPLFVGDIAHGLDSTPQDAPITWSQHVQPLFRSKCGACHMDGSTRGDGYLVDTPELAAKTINPRNPMALIVPGDPENSFLYRKLVDRVPTFGEQMPLATPPLTEHGRELVRRWILEGATSR